MKYYYFVREKLQRGGVLYYGKQHFCERPENITDVWTVEAHGYMSSSGAYRIKKLLEKQFPESEIKVVRV